jgi:hypothetical protein
MPPYGSAAAAQMYRMNPMALQQQYMQQQQMHQSNQKSFAKNGTSSQQASPGGLNLPSAYTNSHQNPNSSLFNGRFKLNFYYHHYY